MDIYTDRPISRLEIIEAGGRRRFSDKAKLEIVAESYSGRRMGSATARKHGITRSQLNDWRRAAETGRLGPIPADGFIPALVLPDVVAPKEALVVEVPPVREAIVVELTGSGRIRICASAPPSLVSAVLKALR
ncbi:MAG: transposase [Microlunatus sp.]